MSSVSVGGLNYMHFHPPILAFFKTKISSAWLYTTREFQQTALQYISTMAIVLPYTTQNYMTIGIENDPRHYAIIVGTVTHKDMSCNVKLKAEMQKYEGEITYAKFGMSGLCCRR